MTKCLTVGFGRFAFWACTILICSAQAPHTPAAHYRASQDLAVTNAAQKAHGSLTPGNQHVTGLADGKATTKPVPAGVPEHLATVILTKGTLTVEANNSDLTQILRDLASESGMTISGIGSGPRIFGEYGPGNFRDVLAALLVGSGYNFIMVGGLPYTTPRELLLTPKNTSPAAIIPLNLRLPPPADKDEDANGNPTVPIVSGPGAVTPAPSPNDLEYNARIEQTLQRLKHLQEQQQSAPQ